MFWYHHANHIKFVINSPPLPHFQVLNKLCENTKLIFFFFLISTYLFIFTKSAVGVSSNEQKFQYYLPAYIQTTKIKFVFYHVRSLLTAPIWMRCLEYLISCDYRLVLEEEPDHLLTCYNQFHSLIIIIFSALWCYLRRITN